MEPTEAHGAYGAGAFGRPVRKLAERPPRGRRLPLSQEPAPGGLLLGGHCGGAAGRGARERKRQLPCAEGVERQREPFRRGVSECDHRYDALVSDYFMRWPFASCPN